MITEKQIIKKWLPIIEMNFGYKNNNLNNVLCIYSEWWFVTKEYVNDELMMKYDEIKEKIHTFDRDNKIEILGEFLNPYSGLIEYKLSTGEFINKGDKIETKLNTSQMLELFGEEFIKFYSLKDFRDIQLGKINI